MYNDFYLWKVKKKTEEYDEIFFLKFFLLSPLVVFYKPTF